MLLIHNLLDYKQISGAKCFVPLENKADTQLSTYYVPSGDGSKHVLHTLSFTPHNNEDDRPHRSHSAEETGIVMVGHSF